MNPGRQLSQGVCAGVSPAPGFCVLALPVDSGWFSMGDCDGESDLRVLSGQVAAKQLIM